MVGYFIIVEGIDGTGQTTVAKKISRELIGGALYYKSPPASFIERCKESIPFSENSFNLFVEGVQCASEEIKILVKKGLNVVADRWIWVTLTHHFAGNEYLHRKWKNRWQDLVSKLIKPNLSLLINVNEAIWLKRMKNRGSLSERDLLLVNNIEMRKKISNLFLTLNPEFTLIDNSGTLKQLDKNIKDALTSLYETQSLHLNENF